MHHLSDHIWFVWCTLWYYWLTLCGVCLSVCFSFHLNYHINLYQWSDCIWYTLPWNWMIGCWSIIVIIFYDWSVLHLLLDGYLYVLSVCLLWGCLCRAVAFMVVSQPYLFVFILLLLLYVGLFGCNVAILSWDCCYKFGCYGRLGHHSNRIFWLLIATVSYLSYLVCCP